MAANSIKILVWHRVEICEFVCHSFKKIRVVYCENFQEISEIVSRSEFDLIISNVRVQRIPGPRFIRTFQKIQKIKRIPVLFLSEGKNKKADIEAVRLGDGFLHWPIHQKVLHWEVSTLLKENVLRNQCPKKNKYV